MKPEDNNPVDGNKLDADLNRIEQAYQRVSADEPPELLDRAVLNKARLATEVKRTGWHFEGFRWVSAFTTASVVVISLALILDQAGEVPVPGDVPAKPVSRTESYEADAFSADDANEMEESVQEPARAFRETEETRAKRAQATEEKIDQPAAGQSLGLSRVAEAPMAVAAPAPVPAEQQRRNDESQVKDEFADRQGIVADNKAILQKSASDTDAPEGARDGMEMAAEPVAESALDAITVTGARLIREPPPPDEWIRRIMNLKEQQLDDQVAQQLTEFRRVYPDYELPEELSRLLIEGE